MSRSLRRGVLAAAAIALSIGSLAACAAGNDAQTLQIKPDNAETTKGPIQVQNALVLTQAGKTEKDAKGPAVVSATIFNNGTTAQTLDGITLPGGTGTVVVKPATGAGKLTIPGGGSVVIGGKGNASAVIEGGSEAIKNGDAQAVVFKLSETGDVALRAFVMPAEGYFESYGPSEAPGAAGSKPSVAPSGTPSGTPSGAATGNPGAKPSGSPSGTPSGAASGAATTTPSGSPSGSPSHSAGH
ncbi:DUF461 domain-containing protein [Streptomyces sp. NPDC002054]|uniref:DUF461 domain-containing protein n=1 Tax=Streptomyces sp. NPDC002054 TaxID=3154663 RepID=UPI00331C80B2